MNRLILITVLLSSQLLIACSEPVSESRREQESLSRHIVTVVEGPKGLYVDAAQRVKRGGVDGVFVLQDGRARFRMLRLGKQEGTQAQVLSGLQGGEQLITGELSEVYDGSKIIVLAQ